MNYRKSTTLNDEAWEKLFLKYNILDKIAKNNYFEITSKQINEFRESRLMTKFDYTENLPSLFKVNDLSILPITRGSYYIAKMNAYHNFETFTDNNKQIVEVPQHIESIDFKSITSEAIALNAAYVSGILTDFTGEEELFPTIDGRMKSDKFEFFIDESSTSLSKRHRIIVRNSQIEIDGGYEGYETLNLIEAKNAIADDFLVRQLYYPYRLWSTKIDKKIIPIYLTYSNGIFKLYKYEFLERNNYSSITLVKQKQYEYEHERIFINEIQKILDNTNIIAEPEMIPFPQADKFDRVVNICELLYENNILTKEEVTNNYAFDSRQTNYYIDAGRYLGLIERNKSDINEVVYKLTKTGEDLFKLDYKKRNLTFVELILQHEVFYLSLKKYFQDLEQITNADVIHIMKKVKLRYKESTLTRRASTVRGWINWILDLAQYV